MKKLYLLFVVFFLVSACQITSGDYGFGEVCFGDNCFFVDIPLSQEMMSLGLMHVEELDLDKGMLFVFEDSARHSFWMKNTLIPLDIIWLDEEFVVVHIEQAMPCVSDVCMIYTPAREALYVLEINQGLARSFDIVVGSVMSFERYY